jgi:hypothetical protein
MMLTFGAASIGFTATNLVSVVSHHSLDFEAVLFSHACLCISGNILVMPTGSDLGTEAAEIRGAHRNGRPADGITRKFSGQDRWTM